jgi:septum formation protein
VHLVLASTSPRRAELLTAAGFTFTVRPVDADESGAPDEPAEAYVRRVATLKALAAAPPAPDTVILAADTVVVLDGARLGKPVDAAEAASMLARLSGRTHEVLTAIALSHRTMRTVDVARTLVTFNVVPPHVIDRYVASGEPSTRRAPTPSRVWRRGSSSALRVPTRTWSASRLTSCIATCWRSILRLH